MHKTLSFVFLCIFLAFSLFLSSCSLRHKHLKKPGATKYTSAATQRATMRSYTVRGRRYHPTYVEVGQVMNGISSWYGPNFHSKRTSNGEVYNMYGYTAAHKTFPMDTMVKVRNLHNGKNVIVRINDRGPFVGDRIIDCSYAAGKKLGLDKVGIAKVSVEVLGFAGKIEPFKRVSKTKETHNIIRMEISNFAIQIGAFRHYLGAKTIQNDYSENCTKYHTIIKRFNVYDEPLYRVWIVGFSSEQEARDFKDNLNVMDAFIIRN